MIFLGFLPSQVVQDFAGPSTVKEILLMFMIIALNQWIGLGENLQESPIFNGKIYGFL